MIGASIRDVAAMAVRREDHEGDALRIDDNLMLAVELAPAIRIVYPPVVARADKPNGVREIKLVTTKCSQQCFTDTLPNTFREPSVEPAQAGCPHAAILLLKFAQNGS